MARFLEMFPRTIWDHDQSRLAMAVQLQKVKEEVDELAHAIYAEPIENVADEACDVMIAAASIVRRVAARIGATPDELLAGCVEKNRLRGYHATPSEEAAGE